MLTRRARIALMDGKTTLKTIPEGAPHSKMVDMETHSALVLTLVTCDGFHLAKMPGTSLWFHVKGHGQSDLHNFVKWWQGGHYLNRLMLEDD